MTRWGAFILAIAAVLLMGSRGGAEASQDAEAQGPLKQFVGVLHAHTTASTGSRTLEQIVADARRAGVDALMLSENFAYRFRYAPLGVRTLFEAVDSTPMLEDFGLEKYVAEVERLRSTNPETLMVLGVEVPPSYFWTGSLFTADLTLHNMQRNVLVMAPPSPPGQTAGQLRELLTSIPSPGNRLSRTHSAASVMLLAPGLLLALVGLWRLHSAGAFRRDAYRSRYVHDESLGRYVKRSSTLARPGVLLAATGFAIGAALLIVNYPYSTYAMSPYDGDLGHRPFEELFSRVREQGGLSYWSMPEATDFHDVTWGPANVRLSTQAHAEVIRETHGYTGFGAMYADRIAATDPGGVWDSALLDFQAGRRERAPWAIGESAFHFPGQAGKQLDDIVTVFLAPELTAAALHDAFERGRSYAAWRRADVADLRLETLTARVPEATAPAAHLGDTLQVTSPQFEVALRLTDADGRNVPVEITLVQDGAVYQSFEAVTPVDRVWDVELPDGAQGTFFRVLVVGPEPTRLVSNPVFVERRVEE